MIKDMRIPDNYTDEIRPSLMFEKIIEDKDEIEKHKRICEELRNIYIKKNTVYGDSFGKTFNELGIISAVTRIVDKVNRIKSLALGVKNEVSNESIEDTLLDLSNYAIMTLMEIRKHRNEK
jgi:hypothetical protein